MTARYTEATVGVVLVAFSALALTQTLAIADGARIFPLIAVATMGFASLVYLARSLLVPRESEPLVTRPGLFLIVLALTLAYMQVSVVVGYVTATLVYIPTVSWLIGFRRPVYLAVVTLVYLASVYLLFEVAFQRRLPPELLIDWLKGVA